MEQIRVFNGGGWKNETVAAIVAAYARVHGCFRLPDFKIGLTNTVMPSPGMGLNAIRTTPARLVRQARPPNSVNL